MILKIFINNLIKLILMHLKIYKKIEEILHQNNVSGKILEVGAMPSTESLLASKILDGCDKVGINLIGSKSFADFKIIEGNANNMNMFKDETFDCVVCNAVLEHDKYFWKSISEMKRILKKNGLLIIGTPSYTNFWVHKITRFIVGKNFVSDFFENMTFCFKIHDYPGDYYRYSEQTHKDVFLKGFKNVQIQTLMCPPRTISYGFKK